MEAEDEYLAALRMDPEEADTCEAFGELYDAQDWPTRAIQYFQRARDLNPFLASARAHLGWLYASRQETELAKAELKEAERLAGPEDVNAEQMLCRAYEQLHDIPSAIEHYELFINAARKRKAQPELVDEFEKHLLELKATLQPQYVKAAMPKMYTEQSLMEAVRQKLTPEEMHSVINPIACNPKMKRWAEQLSLGTTNDFQKAKQI